MYFTTMVYSYLNVRKSFIHTFISAKVVAGKSFCIRLLWSSLIPWCPLVISPSWLRFPTEERQLLTSAAELDLTLTDFRGFVVIHFFSRL